MNQVYQCHYLGEFYSSHVNPAFWRLHGWIDERINDWFQAHQETHPGEITQSAVEGVPWFRKGRWVHTDDSWAGPVERHQGHGAHGGGMPAHDIGKMEKVNEILFGPSPKPREGAARAAAEVEASTLDVTFAVDELRPALRQT